MWLADATVWEPVMIAALTLAGVIFNGLVAIYLARQVRPPSGGRLGEHVENASQIGQANNLLLRKLNGHGLESSRDKDEDAA